MRKKRLTNKVKKALIAVKDSEKLLAPDGRGRRRQTFKKEVQNELCMLKGCFFTDREITEIVNKKHQLKLQVKQVENFFKLPKHREQMLECRQEYLGQIGEVPIAHKRIRLERLEKMYQEGRGEDRIKALVEARKEVEGELTSLTFNVVKKYERMSDEELERRQIELLERIREYSGRIGEAKTAEPAEVLHPEREM